VTPDYEQLRQAAAMKLNMQAARALHYQSYYDNEAGIIALLDTEERQTFKTFLSESGCNWSELVVNAVAERLRVVGFRFGSEADNEAAWTLWQASQMDADHELVQSDALIMSSSFVLVQPDEDNPSGVAITPESAYQATVLYQPGNRRKRLAGYKRYGTDTDFALGEWVQTAGTPAAGAVVEVLITPEAIVTWWPEDPRDAPQVQTNPAGVVSMIEVVPQPRTLGPARSELTPITTIIDRINTTTFNLMVSADYGAFRQVWATGIKIARDVIKSADGTETMVVTRPFDIGANRLLANEAPDGRFGSFPEATLAGYLAAIEQDVTHLAAITQTPAHYLQGRMINLAADAIKAAEAGLVSKCQRRALHIGEAWEEVMRLALGLTGNAAAANVEAEVVWADMETRSEGQRVDALVKMATLGVPAPVLWQKWGATPQEIEAWQAMRTAEGLPPVPPPTAPGAPGSQPAAPPVPLPAPEQPQPEPA
jgi:hypothetical protein